MASKQSAGILCYRSRDGALEVLLVHPGGPLWAAKDAGAWSIPKGEIDPGEDPLAAARREFEEETGMCVAGTFTRLPPRVLKSGKTVHAWAVEADFDPARMSSTTFMMEWPPRSGRVQAFPEVDRHAWFGLAEAFDRINEGQRPLLADLLEVAQRR